MSAMSRRKGSVFERDVARELEALTGVRFQRNLEQVRAADHGDLVPDNDAFPYVIECKRRATGSGCDAAWWAQVCNAAERSGKRPCVIFKYDRRAPRAVIRLGDLDGNSTEHLIEMSVEAFAYVAREAMD